MRLGALALALAVLLALQAVAIVTGATLSGASLNATGVGDAVVCPGGTNPDPNVLFCDNFDAGGWVITDYSDYSTGTNADFGVFASEGKNGTTALRAVWAIGNDNAGNLQVHFGNNPLGGQMFNGTEDFTEIYWREFIKTGADWTVDSTPYKLSRASVFGTAGYAQAAISHIWPDGALHIQSDPANGVNDTNGTLETTAYNDFANLDFLGEVPGSIDIFTAANKETWFCVEAYTKLNDSGANGVVKVWIDDVLDINQTGLNFLGTVTQYNAYGINAIYFENFWNAGAPGARTIYHDNLVISKTRIGCDI